MSMSTLRRKAQQTAPKLPELVSILIIDDERYDRARLRRICDRLDFECLITEADTLQAMGTCLAKDVFDLVFLDFNMPDGNGLAALQAIQTDERNGNAAVIVVTGDEDPDIAISTLRNGCSDFVKKENVTLEAIRRASINALQKAALTKGLERESNSRALVENALKAFTEQCAEEFTPMLYQMMRHIRGLHSARSDDQEFAKTVKKIEVSCERMFDFVKDIEDAERKDIFLSELGTGQVTPVTASETLKRRAEKSRFFGKPI